MTVPGLTTIASDFGPKETMDRLEAEVRAKGMEVFARVDHAAGARQAGMDLRPTELLIFGAAKGGTPLMQASQTMGIDLPLKALVWEDESGRTWISTNDPIWLAQRHGVEAKAGGVPRALSGMLAALTKDAASGGAAASA
jgi:uncharacterized protein (DUF302 family)